MANKRKTTAPEWEPITLLMPSTFADAATDAAHRYRLQTTEYCRRALILRLEADGVRLEDYEAA